MIVGSDNLEIGTSHDFHWCHVLVLVNNKVLQSFFLLITTANKDGSNLSSQEK